MVPEVLPGIPKYKMGVRFTVKKILNLAHT